MPPLRTGLSLALILAWPATAYANSFVGLGAVVAGMLLGVPLGLLLVALIVASLLLARRPDRPRRPRYAWTCIVVSALAPLLFCVVAVHFEGSARGRAGGLIATFALPLVALGAGSVLLARRLLRPGPRRGAAASEPAP